MTLSEPSGRNNWREHANCIGYDHLFFIEQGGKYPPQAKQLCDECPVTLACLNYAIRTRQPTGIWGGKTPTQRKRQREANSRTIPHGTVNAYTNYGCRCNECRQAENEYQRKRYAKRTA